MSASRDTAVIQRSVKAPCSIALIVIVIAPAFLSMSLLDAPPAQAQAPDWVIDKTGVTLDDQTKTVTASIIIEAGGGLTVRNSTIIFNLTKNAGGGILVQPGGTLAIYDSIVRSGNPAFAPTFESLGDLTIDNSDIKDLYGQVQNGGGVMIQSGVAKLTDTTFEANKWQGVTVMGGTVTIRGCAFKMNLNGIEVKTVSGVLIENTQFTGNTKNGVMGVAAGLTIRTSTFSDNNIAIGLAQTEATIKGNTITRNRVGIDMALVLYATVESNKINSNTEAGIRTSGSNPVIKNNEMTGNPVALNMTGGSVTVSGNSIVNNNNGILAKGVSGEISGNTIGGSSAYGIYMIAGKLNLASNNFTPDNSRGRVAWAWKLYINVSKKGDDGLERVIGADVEIYDVDGKIEFSGVTNATGSTKTVDIIERYIDNTGATVDANPHRIKASYKGLKADSDFNMLSNLTSNITLTKPSSGEFPTNTVLLGSGVLLLAIAVGLFIHWKTGSGGEKEREPRIKREAKRRRYGRNRSLTSTAASRQMRIKRKKGRR